MIGSARRGGVIGGADHISNISIRADIHHLEIGTIRIITAQLPGIGGIGQIHGDKAGTAGAEIEEVAFFMQIQNTVIGFFRGQLSCGGIGFVISQLPALFQFQVPRIRDIHQLDAIRLTQIESVAFDINTVTVRGFQLQLRDHGQIYRSGIHHIQDALSVHAGIEVIPMRLHVERLAPHRAGPFGNLFIRIGCGLEHTHSQNHCQHAAA